MTTTTFLVTWEQESSTEATGATSTTTDKFQTTTIASGVDSTEATGATSITGDNLQLTTTTAI